MLTITDLKKTFIDLGCNHILFKPLANNDNSKQQIYLSGDFEVIRVIPSGDIESAGMSKKGPIFKAPLNLHWLDDKGNTEQASGSQLILYPKYPEVRMSGFLQGCKIAPSKLMQPPTREQRAERQELTPRILFLGLNNDAIFSYVSEWESELSKEALSTIEDNQLETIAGTFYNYFFQYRDSKTRLLERLHEIHEQGPIESHRLDKDGNKIAYKAQNGAGYTLEAMFGITPNGVAGPDFEDWELKSHSGSVVTLMTPEPNTGIYLADLEHFIRSYGKAQEERLDFASIHKHGILNKKTTLVLSLEGYDRKEEEITDPDGGLILRDPEGELAAGWTFNKIIDHWKKKHSKTCFVSYKKIAGTPPSYTYGPNIKLAEGATLQNFLNAIHDQKIYYDPGINMKWENERWKPKKRNQIRVKWKDLGSIYEQAEDIEL